MGSGLLEGAQVDGRCDPMESGASVEVLAQVCNLSRGRLVHILSWGLGGGLVKAATQFSKKIDDKGNK